MYFTVRWVIAPVLVTGSSGNVDHSMQQRYLTKTLQLLTTKIEKIRFFPIKTEQ